MVSAFSKYEHTILNIIVQQMPHTVLNFSSVVKPRKYERKTFDGLVSADNGHPFFF